MTLYVLPALGDAYQKSLGFLRATNNYFRTYYFKSFCMITCYDGGMKSSDPVCVMTKFLIGMMSFDLPKN